MPRIVWIRPSTSYQYLLPAHVIDVVERPAAAVQPALGSGGANGNGSRGGTSQASGAAAPVPARPRTAPNATATPAFSNSRRPGDSAIPVPTDRRSPSPAHGG